MKKLNYWKFICAAVFLVSSSVSFSAEDPIFSQPTEKWLPVIAICAPAKIKSKKEYQAHFKIFYHFDKEDRTQIFCGERNIKKWTPVMIKRRGNSSDLFKKKQFLFKFKDPKTDESEKVSLGAMAKGSKWVLNAPYVDRSLIRNIFAYDLGRKIGLTRGEEYFAPRTRSYEVFLNNSYQGVYVLIEKIGRGKEKVDISKLKKQAKDSISFIAEISTNDGDFKTKRRTGINYVYPSSSKLEKIKKEDKAKAKHIKHMIYSEINKLEDVLRDKKKLTATLLDENQNIFDMDSFIDYIIVQEIFKNVDGFRRSVYFHRKDNGKIHMGPLWDFNIALGNLSFYGMHYHDSWLHLRKHVTIRNSFWFKALIENKVFKEKLIKRYHFLRNQTGLLSTQYLTNLIDHKFNELHKGDIRNHIKWRYTYNFKEKYFMTTDNAGVTPKDHVNILKEWLTKRLYWIDNNIEKI